MGVVALVLLWFLLVRLPRPPEPGLVATYQGGKVTKQELRRYLHEYLPRCPRHLRCSLHGQDHNSCADEEECETFTACDKEHSQAHNHSVYRQAAASLVVDRLIGDLVAKKRLGEKKKVRHLMKHVSEQINISDLHRDWHKGKIRVEESEIKDYYEQNRDKFGSLTLSEVTEDIRALLTQEKEKVFVQNYLQELRENSGLTINYDLLKYPQPDEEQLRMVFFEKRDQFRLPARVKLLLIEVPVGRSSQPASELARRVRTLLFSGASLAEVRKSLADRAKDIAISAESWVTERDDLWKKMELARYFPGEVADVVEDGPKLLVARVEDRQEPRAQQFEEVREQLAQEVAEEFREQHLKENLNATLFTIHAEPYSLGDFMQEFQELTPQEQARYSTFEDRKKLVEAMVERVLVVEDASDELRGSKNRKRLDGVRLAVLKQILHQEEVDDKITLTDEELRKYFDKNSRYYRQPSRVKISYIRVSADSSGEDEKRASQKAEKALAELRILSGEQLAGEGFGQVAKRYSDDPDVVKTGGKIEDWISESADLLNEIFYHEFHKNVLSLKKGELSPVFRMGEDFYIVFVRDRQEPRQQAFEEVEELVREDLTEMKHYELTANMEADLVRQAGARIYDYTLLRMLTEETRERR